MTSQAGSVDESVKAGTNFIGKSYVGKQQTSFDEGGRWIEI